MQRTSRRSVPSLPCYEVSYCIEMQEVDTQFNLKKIVPLASRAEYLPEEIKRQFSWDWTVPIFSEFIFLCPPSSSASTAVELNTKWKNSIHRINQLQFCIWWSRTGYGKPWPGPLPDFVNKVVLEHSTVLIHLHIVYGCFHSLTADLNRCNRDCMAHKSRNIYYLALYTEKVCQPLVWGVTVHILQSQKLLIIWDCTLLPSPTTKNVCKTMYSVHFPREKVLAFNRVSKQSRVPHLKPKKAKEYP